MKKRIVSNEELRRFLVKYQNLSDTTCLKSSDEIIDYIRKVGCIQYDPLNVVGRNPDLVLQSRILNYKINDIRKYLYDERKLIDIWDKNMSICCIEDWKYYKYHREKYKVWLRNYKDKVKKIEKYLEENPYMCSSDMKIEQKVGWHYGPQHFTKAALECMCYAGECIVHHKVGNRRYYGLAEKYVPHTIFYDKTPHKTIEDYYEWIVLRRINSIGVLWDKRSDAWLGILGINELKAENRHLAFRSLLEKEEITELEVDDSKTILYISTKNLPLLDEVDDTNKNENSIRFLAPLDNLMWDRKLIKEIFDFDYKWEVYTPIPKRIYGYYVLPILRNNDFVGRIEFDLDKKANELFVKDIWYEKNVDKLKIRDDLYKGIKRFCKYLGCNSGEINMSNFH